MPNATAALTANNPFSAPSTLPLQAPAFDQINEEHYLPAFAAGMEQNLAEIEAIAMHGDAPTFVNTIEAMEKKRVGNVVETHPGNVGQEVNQKDCVDEIPELGLAEKKIRKKKNKNKKPMNEDQDEEVPEMDNVRNGPSPGWTENFVNKLMDMCAEQLEDVRKSRPQGRESAECDAGS